ncbi:hypothetical protein K439DRAFT_1512971, partial [Ramaria rubella]
NAIAMKGDESFWRKHLCHCSTCLTNTFLVQRKPQTCTQCHTLMYLGPTGSPDNHKKEFCSDGGSVKFQDALWPQPAGVFIKGTSFDISAFLHTIREIYKKTNAPVTMEDEAFVSKLMKRLVIEEDGTGLFELFENLKVIGDETLIIEQEGRRLLKVESLQN